MMRSSAVFRSATAALFALILAMRLLTPVGFMPAFEGGKLAIIECPGGNLAPMPAMPGMRHDHRNVCQSCPHATASGGGLIDAPSFAAAVAYPNEARPLLASNVSPFVATGDHDLPPAIGPPFIV